MNRKIIKNNQYNISQSSFLIITFYIGMKTIYGCIRYLSRLCLEWYKDDARTQNFTNKTVEDLVVLTTTWCDDKK